MVKCSLLLVLTIYNWKLGSFTIFTTMIEELTLLGIFSLLFSVNIGMVVTSKESESKINHMAAAGDFDGNVPHLQVFILVDIEAATDRLSFENKLGNGGYGPFYKVNFC
jgi:hypothetical protein